MVFHVVGDRDDPIGTGYFVLLLTKVCQLGCSLHVSTSRDVPVGPLVGWAPSTTACVPVGTSWT